jgi:hypothetical protein
MMRLSSSLQVLAPALLLLALLDEDTNRASATLTVTTFAGSGASTNSDGTGTGAGIDSPRGLAIEPSTGDLLVATGGSEHQLLRITNPGAVVSWWAGGSGSGFLDSGLLSNLAYFSTPTAVAITPWHLGWAADGDVLVADSGNSRLRAVNDNGRVRELSC